MPRKIQRYGWKPDLPDHRDHRYAAPAPVLSDLPPSVDLSPHCPPVYNQETIGSCTAHALAAGFEFDQIKEGLTKTWVPARLFIYYNEREIEGAVNEDSGAQLRDGIKCIVDQGACDESLWPYDVTKFAVKPPPEVYAAAKQNVVSSYSRVLQILSQMKGCLAAGYPFVFGFTVYEAFEGPEVAATGILNMPLPTEQCLGGHAVICVGYDDATQRFLVRNSWGPGWGQKGYFTIPYTYLLDADLACDFWTIRSVVGV